MLISGVNLKAMSSKMTENRLSMMGRSGGLSEIGEILSKIQLTHRHQYDNYHRERGMEQIKEGNGDRGN